MRAQIIVFLALFSTYSFGSFMEVSDKAKKERVIDKKWSMNIGADYRKIETGLPKFDGAHSDIEGNDSVELWGVDLGFSRKLMNIGNFEVEARLGLVYSKTTQSTKGLASKEYDDVDLANERVDYQLLNGRASAIIGYTFETSVVNIRPFVEVGSGVGSSIIEKEYTFEGIETDDSDFESYDYKVNEDFVFTEVAFGVSFVGRDGFYSYLRAAQVASSISTRAIKGDLKLGTAAATEVDTEEKDISTSYSVFGLGVGYAF